MAGIGKYSVRDALNIDVAALWDEQTVATVAATTSTVTVDKKYNMVLVQTDLDIYYTWAVDTTDVINTSNSLYLVGGDDIYVLRVPWGKAPERSADVYLQWQRKGSSDATARHVLA
jgi:hypothetical protein|tara:strand:+ start:884 stop:1231 length:348 start_codon:yes stop_codon:yes gene_type:complete